MDIWVFGYGSLLWNPGFQPAEAVRATLTGYQRSFCMLSIHHRGTEDAPGLVLALDHAPGQTCEGMAFRLPKAEQATILQDLRDRELISSAYLEKALEVALQDGRQITALTYVIDPDHPQYCQFDLEVQAQVIARAVGGRGPNVDYLVNTAQHLHSLGIADPDLDWLCDRVAAHSNGVTTV